MLKYFYENAKVGDHIATYRPQWYMLLSHFISFVQKDKKSHISAIVFIAHDQERNRKVFSIVEQNYPYPTECTVAIEKEGETYSFIDNELKGKHGYLLELVNPLSIQEKAEFIIRWKAKIKEQAKYSFLVYPFTLNWFYNIAKKFFGGKIDRLLDKKSVCSTEALYNLSKISGWEITDNYPTPSEFSKLSIFKQPNKRCF